MSDLTNSVIVTGATGFVGSGVVSRLAAEDVETLACVRRDIDPMQEGVRDMLVAELNATTDWRQVLSGVKSLVHLAARVHVMNDTEADPLTAFRAVNVEGALNLARQAAAAGVKRFVFISSVKVNGESTQPGRAFTEADAPNQRSLVALSNLVDFIVTCITHPPAANQTFLVSDGQDLSTTELVRGMAQAAGVPARLLPVPVWALQAGASLLGKGDAVQRLCGNLQVDISKGRAVCWVGCRL